MGKKIKEEKDWNKKTEVGNIEIPVTKVDNGLCLRTQICSATDSEKRKWDISFSGVCIVIDVPGKHRHYTVNLQDILSGIVDKEDGEDK